MQIHELNEYGLTPGDNTFLAIDDGTDTGKISGTNLLKGVNDRIDNMVANVRPDSVKTLWTGSAGKTGDVITLSESAGNFDFLDFYTGNTDTAFIRVPASKQLAQIQTQNMRDASGSGENFIQWFETALNFGGTSVNITGTCYARWDGLSGSNATFSYNNASYYMEILRIDGVKISALENAEVVDARIGANGTTYPSLGDAIRGQCTLLKNDLTGLEDYSGAINRPRPAETIGAYLSGTGSTYNPNNGFKYTAPFLVKAGSTVNVKAKGYSTVVNIISSTTDGGASYREVVRCTDSTYKWYSTTVSEDTYLIVCGAVSAELIIYIVSDEESEIKADITDLQGKVSHSTTEIPLTWVTGYYLSGNGSTYNPNGSFKYSNPFYIGRRCTLKIFAKGYSTVVNILSKLSEKGGYYKEVVRCTDGTLKWYEADINEAGFYTICSGVSADVIAYITNEDDSPNENIIAMYNKIICCGDSLTYGLVYTSASNYRQARVPYNEALQKITGVPSVRYATAGYTSKDWWLANNSHLNEDGLYIIFLGTNGGLTDTINTDCAGDDPNNYADTQTGYYGRILRTLEINKKTAVLIKPPAANAETQGTIQKFADRFGCAAISLPPELENNYYHYAPHNVNYSNAIHYNDLGYVRLANAILNAVNNLSLRELFLIAPYEA